MQAKHSEKEKINPLNRQAAINRYAIVKKDISEYCTIPVVNISAVLKALPGSYPNVCPTDLSNTSLISGYSGQLKANFVVCS